MIAVEIIPIKPKMVTKLPEKLRVSGMMNSVDKGGFCVFDGPLFCMKGTIHIIVIITRGKNVIPSLFTKTMITIIIVALLLVHVINLNATIW